MDGPFDLDVAGGLFPRRPDIELKVRDCQPLVADVYGEDHSTPGSDDVMPTFEKPEDATNGLHTLLLKAVPENKHGNKTITYLAELLHLNQWSIKKWIRREKLSPERAIQVVEISKIEGFDPKGKPILGEPRVKLEEFDPYVYKV
jgi:hypothetical protein